ncbi:hypothetical protein [Alteromonas hispanica]|uniref:Uncharacterized protein n=1 Tax=Alteromonas hispanica TaxID=315421 RepID=A0A6L9MXV7_9ALTE|nr:hypothetical protein [Alteromonas hispanica]NDW22996.1 hypothetical protein [Alteromonas hispanica]
MKADVFGVRLIFGFLTVAMLIAVRGLFFDYDLKILALATGCLATFFFITTIRAKQLAQSNFKFTNLQKVSVGAWALLTALSFVSNAT